MPRATSRHPSRIVSPDAVKAIGIGEETGIDQSALIRAASGHRSDVEIMSSTDRPHRCSQCPFERLDADDRRGRRH